MWSPPGFGADALGGAVNLVSEGARFASRAALSYQAGSFDTHRFTLDARHVFDTQGLYARVNAFGDSSANDHPIDVEVTNLYLSSDSFDGFTFGSSEPKSACVLRVRAGSDSIDPSYRFAPTDALGSGLAPWGLYLAGNGSAYTTAVDPAQLPEYDSVFEFIFAPVHQGYTLDVRNLSAARIESMPPDPIGFESVTVDDQLLVPRSTAAADI